jgi:hypothetical protein
MSEMVERVAKALSIADGNHPDACSNDEDSQPIWHLYTADARAAIEAMREPTQAMIHAGQNTYCDHGDQNCGCAVSWSAMIESALCGEPAKQS